MNHLQSFCLACLLIFCTIFFGAEQVSANPQVVLNSDGSTIIISEVSESSEFTITPKNPPGGANGINDYITWSFDFVGIDFLTPLTEARLTLQLDPQPESIAEFLSDRVQIDSLSWISNIASIASEPINGIVSIEFDLLDFLSEGLSGTQQDYSSEKILNVLEENDGEIPFRYEDDALVEAAKLELVVTCKTVPPVIPPNEIPCLEEDPCKCDPCAPGCPIDRVFDCKRPFFPGTRFE